MPNCKHPKKQKAFACDRLRRQDVKRFHAAFYQTYNKVDQDNFLNKHTRSTKPARRRKQGRESQVSIKYYINTKKKGFLQVTSF